MTRLPHTPPRPPTPEEALDNVNTLLAESVGRNTLAMVEGIRNITGRLDRSDVLVALTLARLGRASLEELLADLHNMNVTVSVLAVETALLMLEDRGLITRQTDERGDVWQAVAGR